MNSIFTPLRFSALLLLVASACFGQFSTTSGGLVTISSGISSGVTVDTGTVPNAVIFTDGTTTGRWRAVGGVPAETRKLRTPMPTLASVRAAVIPISNYRIASPAYLRLARTLGLDSVPVGESRLLQAISDNGYKIYDYKKVDDFLYNQALKMKSNTRWVWKPLRNSDFEVTQKNASWQIDLEMGFVYPKLYAHAVPMPALAKVAALMREIPDLVALISDYEVIKPDPFLAVTTPKLLSEGKIFIIDQWDEPGFGDDVETPTLTARK